MSAGSGIGQEHGQELDDALDDAWDDVGVSIALSRREGGGINVVWIDATIFEQGADDRWRRMQVEWSNHDHGGKTLTPHKSCTSSATNPPRIEFPSRVGVCCFSVASWSLFTEKV